MSKLSSALLLVMGLAAMLAGTTSCDRGTNNTQTKETAWEENGAESGVETPGVGTAADSASTATADVDATFLLEAYSYGLMIIQYSQQAIEKAQTPAVKSFAEQSAEWHRKTKLALEQKAAKKDLTLPEEPGDDVQNYMDRLEALTADEYEIGYLQVLRRIQQSNLEQFQIAADGATDADIRSWAAENLPNLQAHAQATDELMKQLREQ